MICIYSPTNTNYSNNGDAVLIPTRCELSMSINGAWQLSMEHPYDPEERYKYIQEGAVIRADIRCISELDTVQQRFRIYTYQRNLTNVTCIAFPVAMESNFDAPVDNLVLQNKTASQAISSIQALTNKYTITTNVTGTASSSWANTNINGILASGDDGCFIKVWGGEVLYDNLKFNIRQRIGSDNGFKVEYGHNLTGIDYSKDDSGLSTRVHPISQDGIRLNGDGYVDSPHINDYPIVHDRYMQAPYTLVEDDAASPSRTAQKTRETVAAITSTTTSLSETAYSAAISAGYQPEYIKTIQKDIVTAVQTMALYGVVSADLYKLMANTIANAMAWLGNLEQPEWEWRGSDSTGWWYGNDDGYAENMYVRIGRTWSYFGSNGYWQEPADDSEEWDWYEPKDGSGKKYGNFKKYFAHNEFVYITVTEEVEGVSTQVLKKYWFDEEGWYDEDQSGDSEWDWHGSGTALDPYWFGEEAAGDDEKKYAHSCWLFIDGVLYFFDQYGYYDGSTKFDDYQWDWVESDARYWFGNAEDNAYAATYLTSQWEKIDGAWYYFDANGYVIDTETSKSTAIGVWTTNMASLTTAIGTYSTQLYTLLYTIMTEWVNKLYASGIDLPALTINVSMVDLSKTSEYENYAELATVKLGDGIVVDDPAHGITLTNRVIGLTYDCIREYNSYVVIGKAAATVQSMLSQASGEAVAGGFDTSALETQINSKMTDVRYKGASLVQNHVGILDNAITEVIANPEGQATTDLEKIQVGSHIYDIPGGGGLQYWTETSDQFYRAYEVEGMSADDGYIFTEAEWYNEGRSQAYYGHFLFHKANDKPAIMIVNGLRNSRYFYLVSTDADAVAWEYKEINHDTGWLTPSENGENTGTERNVQKGSFTFDGATWYISKGYFNHSSADVQTYECPVLESWSVNDSLSETGLKVMDESGATPTTHVWVGLGKDTKILYHKIADKFVSYLDENGVFEGTDYKVNGTSLVTIINGKQDTLIAGTNINIASDGKTISATDTDELSELDDVSLSNLSNGQILKYNSITSKWENGTGGGSTVVANPSGTATADLNKIGIDNVIYSIPSGGGGSGSGYQETVLWDTGGTTSRWADPVVATLSDSLRNYDEIRIRGNTDGASEGVILTIPTSEIPSDYSTYYFENAGYRILYANADSATQISLYTGTGITITYTKIVGVKYGGASEVTYSTTEQKVGKWIDGSDIYQITLDLGSNVNFSSGWQNVVAHQGAYELVFGGELTNTSGIGCRVDMACNDSTYLELYATHNTSGRYLTFQYIKTSS